jgi:uncharacterized SAM-binding protein YcdF (DUF218 family)
MHLKIIQIKNRYFITIIACIIFLLDLVFLYYIKYQNQRLPFSDFNILYVGNIFNFSFTFLTISGLIIYTVKLKSDYNRKFIIANTTVITALLLLSVLSTVTKLPLPDIYFLDHPLSEIFVGFMFVLFQFMQFVFMIILWMASFGIKDLIILRGIVNATVLLFLLLFFTFVFINVQKENGEKNNTDKKDVNIAVVLGAAVWSFNSPSPSLAARVDKAVQLYKKGIVNKIQLTGSNAPGELSEAEVAYNYIKLSDINLSDVLMEKKTVSTVEQIRYIKEDLLKKKNIGKVIIVSDAYHLARVQEICIFFKVPAYVSPSDLNLSFQSELFYKIKESIALTVFWFFAL